MRLATALLMPLMALGAPTIIYRNRELALQSPDGECLRCCTMAYYVIDRRPTEQKGGIVKVD